MTGAAENGTKGPPSKTSSEREAMIDGRTSGAGRGATIGIVALLAATGVAGYFLLVPDSPDTSGPSTSQTAEMQDREGIAGVDTAMPRPQTAPATADAPDQSQWQPAVMAGPVNDGGAADRARIAELERDLAALRASQGDDPTLQEALQSVRDEMQALFDRERAEAEERYQLQLAAMARDMSSGQTGMSDEERDARARLEEERQRRAAIAEAQIMSDGIVLDASGAKTGGGSQGGAASGSPGGGGRTLSSNEQFIQDASTQSYETVRATRIAAPDRTIVQGTTLNAVLETAISTELPGVIRAVVTDDVMSYDGLNALLPRGTRLIGSYNSDVSVVQGRVQIAWNRAVTPEGVSVELGGYGADALGMSGQAGTVDTRFRQRFGSAALISLMGAGPDVIVGRDTGGQTSDAVQDVGDDLSTATQGVVADYLKAGPVIYIDQGTTMTVFVNRDLVL